MGQAPGMLSPRKLGLEPRVQGVLHSLGRAPELVPEALHLCGKALGLSGTREGAHGRRTVRFTLRVVVTNVLHKILP